jgi:hypothetical protein
VTLAGVEPATCGLGKLSTRAALCGVRYLQTHNAELCGGRWATAGIIGHRNGHRSLRVLVPLAFAIPLITSCGGGSPAARSTSGVQPTGTTDPGTPPPFNPYFNSDMIGQTWALYTADGKCKTFFSVEQIPPSTYYPLGSINLHIAKLAGAAGQPCYWAATVPDAAIEFILSQMQNGAFNSPGWFFHAPDGLPSWWPCRTDPCSQEIKATIAVSPTPYQIVPPPDLQHDQVIDSGDTAYTVWNAAGMNWTDFTSGQFHASGQYWRTKFYMVNDPVWGWLAVSEQFEADCGHERWYWKAGVGLIRIESPNDGHPGGTATTCGDKFVPTIERATGFIPGQELL